MDENSSHQVKDINVLEDALVALEAVEQLLCMAGTGHQAQMHDVHSDYLSTLIYVIRDRMFQGVYGASEREISRRRQEAVKAFARRRSAA